MVRCLYSGLVGGLPFVARVALLACVGGLAFVVCAFGGFLLWLSPAYAFLTIASLCNKRFQTGWTQIRVQSSQTTTSPCNDCYRDGLASETDACAAQWTHVSGKRATGRLHTSYPSSTQLDVSMPWCSWLLCLKENIPRYSAEHNNIRFFIGSVVQPASQCAPVDTNHGH